MYALVWTSFAQTFCGSYATANAQSDEVVPMADEKGSVIWKAFGMLIQGCALALTGEAADAVQMITPGTHRIPVNGNNHVDADVFVIFGEGLYGAWAIR